MLLAMPPMLPGAITAMIGFAVVMGVVFGAGGAAKSKQFAVVGEVMAGQHGKARRAAFLVGLVLTVFGTCGAFAGVAAGDAQRKQACERVCTGRGYAQAEIRGSTERNPPGSGKHAFVACACSAGPDPDPLELRADDLPPQ